MIKQMSVATTYHALERAVIRTGQDAGWVADQVALGNSLQITRGVLDRSIELIYEPESKAFLVAVLSPQRDAVITVLTLAQARNTPEMSIRLHRANFLKVAAMHDLSEAEAMLAAGLDAAPTLMDDFIEGVAKGQTVIVATVEWGNQLRLFLNTKRRSWWVGKVARSDLAAMSLTPLADFISSGQHEITRGALMECARRAGADLQDAMVMADRADELYFNARIVVEAVTADGRIREVVLDTPLSLKINFFDAETVTLNMVEMAILKCEIESGIQEKKFFAVKRVFLRNTKRHILIQGVEALTHTDDQIESVLLKLKWMDPEELGLTA